MEMNGLKFFTREGGFSGEDIKKILSYAENNPYSYGNVTSVASSLPNMEKYCANLCDMIKKGVPTIHVGNCPDLGPILFAVAAAKHGAVFAGTRRLKIKESDRAAAMAEELAKFGVSVTVYDDKVVVYPIRFHAPSVPLSGHNDHRIVMALAVLLTVVGGEISGAEAINKSYPEFFEDLRTLGIEVFQYE
jgi:3-phosphoshikimate 1-carboxyvinyltransferase